MKKRLRVLAEHFPLCDTVCDWEERGLNPSRIPSVLEEAFRGELDHIRLYNNNGKYKWVFLGDYHAQPWVIYVGRYSSPKHYRNEHSLLRALHTAVPQFFPSTSLHWKMDSPHDIDTQGIDSPILSVSLVESLIHMETAWDFRERRRDHPSYPLYLEILARQEGYAAGFVLGKTKLVLTDPHPLNTLVYPVSDEELIIKFVDAERLLYCGDFSLSIQRLREEYNDVQHVRTEVIKNEDLFLQGLEQGLQDSEEC